MAAVECSSIDRKEMGDKCTAKLNLICKKNGLNHACFCEENVVSTKRCKAELLDKILRLNGSVKPNNNSFPRPSVPVLRTRKERHSSGSETSKRRRRSSRHDPGDSEEG